MPGSVNESTKAVILVSGGLDSATALAIARSQGFTCYAISFDYGQKHRAELAAATEVSNSWAVVEHRIMRLDMGGPGGSALTDEDIDVPEFPQTGIPITYVPARNTVFLSLALGYAEIVGAGDIFIGVNAVDYSGYPDCRPEFIKRFAALANVATKAAVEGQRVTIHAPLINMNKAEIIKVGIELGIEYSMTVSCYQADEAGRACGVCDSCRFRHEGFVSAKVQDPTRYR